MIFVELLVPRDTLTQQQCRDLAQNLVTGMMPAEEGAPPEAVDAARAFTQVVIHEPDTWVVGTESVTAASPRYFVRVSMPASWRKEMSPIIIPEITRILAEVDPEPSRLHDEPIAWVHLVGIAEGSCGMFGTPMGSTDIVRTITGPYSENVGASAADLPPGTALDPVCGMTVPLESASRVVQHEGITYAFCGNACHAVFAEDQRAAAGAGA